MTTPEQRDPGAPQPEPDPTPAVADFSVPAAAAAGPGPEHPDTPDWAADWHGYTYGDPDAARRARRRTATVAALVALGVAVFGGVVGWIWAEVTPRLQVIKADKGFLYADPEPEQPIAADGWFFLLGLGLGIALAVLAWVVLRRYRGAALLAALTVGSLLGAIFALWVGYKISYGQFSPVAAAAPVGAQLGAPITVHISDLNAAKLNADPLAALWAWPPRPNGLVAVQALAVAFVYTCLAGFSLYPDLGRRRRPTPPDDPAPDAPPPAEPAPPAPAA